MGIYDRNDDFTIRDIQIDDFAKEYKALLENLTVTGDLNNEKFIEVFNYHQSLQDNYSNIVIEENSSGLVVGNGALFMKYDFGSNGEKVGMIEDIVVVKRLQGKGLGKKIIMTLLEIAKDKGCKKVRLDCSEENVAFYVKCGLIRGGIEMGLYF